MATGPTGYDIVALVIAGVGLILAVASLTWNVAEYRLSGPRVKVHLRIGARRDDAIMSIRGTEPPDPKLLISQGFTEPLVGVEVTNLGRAPTEVQTCNCQLSNGFGFFVDQYPGNPTLSYRLEARATRTWWVPLLPIQEMASAGLSRNFAAAIKSGRSVPHARHWSALREIGVAPTP